MVKGPPETIADISEVIRNRNLIFNAFFQEIIFQLIYLFLISSKMFHFVHL